MKAKKNWGIDSTKERVNKNTDGGVPSFGLQPYRRRFWPPRW